MNRVFRSDMSTLVPGLRILSANFTTTTSGAISGTTATGFGMTVVKTASKTGRYTCQLVNQDGSAADALAFIGAIVNVVGPDDAALTTTKGLVAVVRDIDIGAGAQDGTVEIQFVQTNAGNADTEVQDGASVYITLLLRDRDGVTG